METGPDLPIKVNTQPPVPQAADVTAIISRVQTELRESLDDYEKAVREVRGRFMEYRRYRIERTDYYLHKMRDTHEQEIPEMRGYYEGVINLLENHFTPDWFDEKVLPTLCRLEAEPNGLRFVGKYAQQVLEIFMANVSRGLPREMVDEFFAPYEKDQYTHNLSLENIRGQFEFFFKQTPFYVYVPMVRQIRSFGMDLDEENQLVVPCNSTRAINELVELVLGEMDSAGLSMDQKKDAVNAFIQTSNEVMFAQIGRVVRILKTKRKLKLFDVYLKFFYANHVMVNSSFQFVSSEEVVAELEAFERLKGYKKSLTDFLVQHYDKIKDRITFDAAEGEEGTYNFALVIKNLEEKGYSSAKIRAILKSLTKRTGLRKAAPNVLKVYPELDQLPGGADRLIKAMEKAPTVLNMICIALQRGEIEEIFHAQDLEGYLGLGCELTEKIGDVAYQYFAADLSNPRFTSLFNEDPEMVSKNVFRAQKICGALNHITSHEDCSVATLGLFKLYVDTLGDPNFEDFHTGVKYLTHNCINFFNSKEGIDTNWKDRALLIERVFWDYLNEINERSEEKKLEHHELPEMDYFQLASRLSCLYFQADPVTTRYADFPKDVAAFANDIRLEIMAEDNCGVLLWDEGREAVEQAYAQLDAAAEEHKDPEVLKLLNNVRRYIRRRVRSTEFYEILNSGFVNDAVPTVYNTGISLSPWYERASVTTQFICSSTALLSTLGLFTPDWLRAESPLADQAIVEAYKRGDLNIEQLIGEMFTGPYRNQLGDSIRATMPKVAAYLRQKRDFMPGLMPVGTKIHTPTSINPETLQFLQDAGAFGGVGHTPFKLIHSNSTIVPPPTPSSAGSKLLANFFYHFGGLTEHNPALQIALGARVSGKKAAILGASTLLSTHVKVRYADEAFSTGGHDRITGARMMAYDAGVKSKNMPFDLANAHGRTDILGREDLTDIDYYQIVGTPTSHAQCGGRFAEYYDVYDEHFRDLLRQVDLEPALRESAWIYNRNNESDSLEYHSKMIRRFTDAWDQFPKLRGAVRAAIHSVAFAIRQHRELIIREEPEEYEKLMNY